MKLILNCYYDNRTNVSTFNALLKDGSIYFGLNPSEVLPVFAYKQLANGSNSKKIGIYKPRFNIINFLKIHFHSV